MMEGPSSSSKELPDILDSICLDDVSLIIEFQLTDEFVQTGQIQNDNIRASPMVQADETGWREDGINGYVWTFSTPTEQYFLRRGRDKGVVDEVLDETFSGVVVSDFYAAYNHYAGLKQRCWAHLLRDIHELKVLYPDDSGLAQWAKSVHKIYEEV